jgi:hypothetical protein
MEFAQINNTPPFGGIKVWTQSFTVNWNAWAQPPAPFTHLNKSNNNGGGFYNTIEGKFVATVTQSSEGVRTQTEVNERYML